MVALFNDLGHHDTSGRGIDDILSMDGGGAHLTLAAVR